MSRIKELLDPTNPYGILPERMRSMVLGATVAPSGILQLVRAEQGSMRESAAFLVSAVATAAVVLPVFSEVCERNITNRSIIAEAEYIVRHAAS